MMGNAFNVPQKMCISISMTKSENYRCFREDLTRQAGLTEKYHGRMKELQILLESSRSRVQVNITYIDLTRHLYWPLAPTGRSYREI